MRRRIKFGKSFTYDFGLHSNIPECCVFQFYIRELHHLSPNPEYKILSVDKDGFWTVTPNPKAAKDSRRVEYIRCKKCMREDYFQDIHTCDKQNPDCKRYLEYVEKNNAHISLF